MKVEAFIFLLVVVVIIVCLDSHRQEVEKRYRREMEYLERQKTKELMERYQMRMIIDREIELKELELRKIQLEMTDLMK